MKRLVFQAIIALAEAFGAVIRKGRRIPTVLGALVGAGGWRNELGTVLRTWSFQWLELTILTVLLERAVYVLHGDAVIREDVLAQLNQGIDPEQPSGTLIRFGEIKFLDLRKPGAKELQIVYPANAQIKSSWLNFQSLADRNDFLAALEKQIGGRLVPSDEPMETAGDPWPADRFRVVGQRCVDPSGGRTVPAGPLEIP
jgi:hypothetical protein